MGERGEEQGWLGSLGSKATGIWTGVLTRHPGRLFPTAVLAASSASLAERPLRGNRLVRELETELWPLLLSAAHDFHHVWLWARLGVGRRRLDLAALAHRAYDAVLLFQARIPAAATARHAATRLALAHPHLPDARAHVQLLDALHWHQLSVAARFLATFYYMLAVKLHSFLPAGVAEPISPPALDVTGVAEQLRAQTQRVGEWMERECKSGLASFPSARETGESWLGLEGHRWVMCATERTLVELGSASEVLQELWRWSWWRGELGFSGVTRAESVRLERLVHDLFLAVEEGAGGRLESYHGQRTQLLLAAQEAGAASLAPREAIAALDAALRAHLLQLLQQLQHFNSLLLASLPHPPNTPVSPAVSSSAASAASTHTSFSPLPAPAA